MILLVSSLLTSTSLATDTPIGANSLAMGQTGVADLNDNAAIVLNPGMLALTERYDFMGSFGLGPEGGMHWTGSAMDARTSDDLAAGLVYSGDRQNPDLTLNDMPGWVAEDEEITNLQRTHDFEGAVSVPFAKRLFAIGVGASFGLYFTDRHGSGWIADASSGIGFHPTPWLSFGGSVRNFVPGPNALDVDTTIHGGARAEIPQVATEVDLRLRPLGDKIKSILGAGVELPIGSARLRAGYKLDEEQHSNVTAGIGYEKDGAGLEYGILIPIQGFDLGGTIHQVTIRFAAGAEEPEEPEP